MELTLGFYCNRIIPFPENYNCINHIKRHYFYGALAGNRKKKYNHQKCIKRDCINEIPLHIAALRGIATKCKLGSLTEELISDQLIETCCQIQIRDHLLLEPEVALQNSIMIAKQVE